MSNCGVHYGTGQHMDNLDHASIEYAMKVNAITHVDASKRPGSNNALVLVVLLPLL